MKKYTLKLCILLLFIFSPVSSAQAWVARYNGPGNGRDQAYAIAVDNTGNILVTGRSLGSGTFSDFATIKYDSLGTERWVARYNGPGNGNDIARAIAIDDANNVYVTGEDRVDTDSDFVTVKYDSSGVEQWVARYNGPGNGVDGAWKVTLDEVGNVYVTGWSFDSSSDSDYATVKYNSSGVEEWVVRYNGPGNNLDEPYAIAVDNGGNILVTGKSWGSGTDFDYATIKYDSSGVEQWVTRYDGPSSYWDWAWAMCVDATGNVYVTGASCAPGSFCDYATVKYNSAGVEQWVARYDGPDNSRDEAFAIAVDNNGNVYITGTSYGLGTFSDYATVKYDSLGIEQWVARYDGPGSGDDYAAAIAVSNLSSVCVTGTSWGSNANYDYATAKYNSSGVEQWVARYNGPGNDDDIASALAVDNSGNVFVTGHSTGSVTEEDYVTIKYLSTGVSEDLTSEVKSGGLVTSIISGPLLLPEGKKCRVFDITGRVVAPDKIQPGIYFIEVDGVVTQKVIKVK